MNNATPSPRAAPAAGLNPVLAQLRREIGALDGSGPAAEAGVVNLGLGPVDAALPWGGLPRAALHEIAGPAQDGAAFLYTREHFTAVRNRLAPNGLFCQWLPLYQMDLATVDLVANTFRAGKV